MGFGGPSGQDGDFVCGVLYSLPGRLGEDIWAHEEWIRVTVFMRLGGGQV